MDMQPFDTSQSQWQRAWRDTAAAIHSGWWFWAAEVALAAVASVFAVSLYREGSSRFEQAVIQASIVVSAFISFALLVLIANLVAWSPHRQRNEARQEVGRLNTQIAEVESNRLTRQDLVDARQKLGSIMSDAGDLIAGAYGSSSEFAAEAMKIFDAALDLFRGDSPFFDESHAGRFYAVLTLAGYEATKEVDISSDEGVERHVLIAEIGFFERLVGEINTELLTLPR